ncbi:DUF418 domain-containing protein [Aurantiacibacter gangjinensis]|uniref:Uncharacterized protein n=1 Tax=Aurantiacibacter gangjinensis TaxID=502682 RepID=A0A0G9MS55_9SPHN|nr:DUF418 domain-containing protein [Aurantiacibacter gangjinensis]APE27144.1 membrane protein, putative [Aurantiacibacter gangjinensis]KLE33550.1 hypothetical protein AAW01_06565 [Aurantiacibacter gangjinensis]
MTETQTTPDGEAVPPAPAKSGERILGLDFIRGIAVLGILAANIVAFGQPWAAYMMPSAFLVPHDSIDEWLYVAQFTLIDGKMRGLFTLLFGAGMALFMERAWARGSSRWLQVRRLGWLLVFGLIHFFLIWRGDILTLYAVAGFVAVLFVRMEGRALMALGLSGYALGALVYFATIGSAYFIAETPLGQQEGMEEGAAAMIEVKQETLDIDARERPIMESGSYVDYVTNNVTNHAADILNMLWLFAFETLPLMLVGMAMYKFGWFSPGGSVRKRQVWAWSLLLIGGALSLLLGLWLKSIGFTYWSTIAAFVSFSMLPRLLMILGLAVLLAQIGATASGWLAERLSAAGRAAFTNYLGTSVLMMLIFHPWAGGLWGELSRPELYLVVALAWAIMLAWSKPWLERYRYGPLEWLWRCLTYWKRFPLRR